MSDDEKGAGIGVTLKAGTDFSAPWITPRATSVGDLKEMLGELEATPEVVPAVVRLARAFQAEWAGTSGSTPPVQAPVAAQQAAPAPAYQQPAQQAPAAPQAAGGGKFCQQCGQAMTYKEGQNQNTGRAWKGFFCSDKSHKPEWVR